MGINTCRKTGMLVSLFDESARQRANDTAKTRGREESFAKCGTETSHGILKRKLI